MPVNWLWLEPILFPYALKKSIACATNKSGLRNVQVEMYHPSSGPSLCGRNMNPAYYLSATKAKCLKGFGCELNAPNLLAISCNRDGFSCVLLEKKGLPNTVA